LLYGYWCMPQVEDGSWQWRTNLAASSPYWRGWYEGLSDAFLALPVPKMLLLAGTDRCAGWQLQGDCLQAIEAVQCRALVLQAVEAVQCRSSAGWC
jgi:hypothetical protein